MEWPVKRIILVVPTKLCTEIFASEVLSEIDFMGKNYNETNQWFWFVYMLGKKIAKKVVAWIDTIPFPDFPRSPTPVSAVQRATISSSQARGQKEARRVATNLIL